jgi:hypothetical protein
VLSVILIKLLSIKDVWFGFRNCIQKDVIVSCKNQKELIIQLGKEYFPMNQSQVMNHQENTFWFKDFPRPKKIYCSDGNKMFCEYFTLKDTCLGYTHFVTSYEKQQTLRQSKARATRIRKKSI